MKTQELFNKYIKSEEIKKHCLEVSTIMKFLAKELGEDEEKWASAGLMHDMDCDITPEISVQGKKAAEIAEQNGYSKDICHAILSHNEDNLGIRRESKFDYMLSAADNISGLIYAYGLMRKSLDGMDVSGLKKKLKNKAFAASVRRDLIQDAEKFMPLNKFLEIAIKSMESIKGEIGF
ncbi:MAG: HD domain-containing protein [Nanoarchaeota archaeon]|nr:HD domain-containing protein [Nanoarchaeota archaeon]